MNNRETQRILTDDEIVNILINYVDEDLYRYAVMIDGEWEWENLFRKKTLYKLNRSNVNNDNK